MGKLQLCCMQCLATEVAQFLNKLLARTTWQREPASVHRVADKRVPAMCKMHPNLMRASGLQAHSYISMGRKPLNHGVVGPRLLAIIANAHAFAVRTMPSDRCVDRATACQHSVTNREVIARDIAVSERTHERRMCRQGPGDEKQAARVLVEPVNDAGSRQHLERRLEVQQAIQQSAARVARTRVHDQPGWLVDDDQVFILENDVEFDGLRLVGDCDISFRSERDLLAPLHSVPRARRLAVDADRAIQQPCLQPAARIFRKQPGQRLVQALTGSFDRDGPRFRIHRSAKSTVYSPTENQNHTMKSVKSTLQTPSRTRIRLLPLIAAAACLALSSCSGNDEKEEAINSVDEAYEKARTSIERGNYRRGIQILEAIQARFPFSERARQVQLDLIHAYYKGGQQEQAIEAADTFLRENPTHPSVDYALYIKGLANFERDTGWLERKFGKSVTERPPDGVQGAYSTLRRLVERYPASKYAADARQRMQYLKNRMAAYENHVAGYYLRRGAYVAALNRSKSALEDYNGAPANAESLRIMARAYDELGMADLAADTRRVLALNFPE